MTDAETLAVYDARAQDYARLVASSRPDAQLLAFMALLPAGGHVLDLGCGPAAASAHMRAEGFTVDPVDASARMVALANDTFGIGARQATFDEITGEGVYDGVWANFSLLHAPRADLPGHLARLCTALRPGGALHIGMKTGTGEARDAIGRFYTFVTVTELQDLLATVGLTVVGTDEGKDRGLSGSLDPWVVCRARKHG